VASGLDKYEFNLKVDQIKKLAAKKAYKEAAEIAKSMNWQKVKDWSTLATVINVQEAVGDYMEARDMAILAYNRNLGGRKLVYKLIQMLIKLEDFSNAEQLYTEYEKMSQHDVNRFILLYDLRRAQKASNNELVEILEDYKEHEIDEKYMYELAKLYAKTGRKEECVKTCDDIVLWFQDGIYVERAIKLKQESGVALSGMQKKILEDLKHKKDDEEEKRERLFEQQKELARIQQDDVEEVFLEDELTSTGEKTEDTTPIAKNQGLVIPFETEEDDEASEEVIIQDIDDEEDEADEEQTTSLEKASIDLKKNFGMAAEKKPETPVVPFQRKPLFDYEPTEQDKENESNTINKASLSLKELIELAKKKIEDNCDQIKREDREESIVEEQAQQLEQIKEREDNMDIQVNVPNYNLYDTQNIQAELAKNLSELMDTDDEELDALRPQPQAPAEELNTSTEESQDEDEQIEGQLSLADWMESVREEKYGKQNTREYSKAELDRMLDEKDEKSAAYEKLMAEQKARAKAEGTTFNEEEASAKAYAQMMLHAAKTDLAIRTGKATAKLEEAVEHLREAVHVADDTMADTIKEINPSSEEYTATDEQISLETAPIHPITDQILSSVREIMAEQDAAKKASPEKLELDDVKEEVQEESVTPEEAAGEVIQAKPEEPKETMKPETNKGRQEKDKVFTGELEKLFRKYREMPGLEAQLVDYFNAIEEEMNISTSAVGNLIISGNSSSDKTDLARTIIKAINMLYPDQPKKIAKTTGESINHRGIAKAMNKLKGTALIVEGAGGIQPKRINELLSCLEEDTERMIVIFEDSDAEMNVLINFNPELTDKFNHRIVLKQYTVNELVEMARKFAHKRQYEVDDDALLELYLKIDKLRNVNDNIKLDDIKEIINQAIIKSEKRASKRFFGGLKKKRGENGDIFFLSEADFKD
jgi:hypothetical protein